ncbi:hypothetical protein V8C42DRAFT_327402 [Trichoderma barbatum]
MLVLFLAANLPAHVLTSPCPASLFGRSSSRHYTRKHAVVIHIRWHQAVKGQKNHQEGQSPAPQLAMPALPFSLPGRIPSLVSRCSVYLSRSLSNQSRAKSLSLQQKSKGLCLTYAPAICLGFLLCQ